MMNSDANPAGLMLVITSHPLEANGKMAFMVNTGSPDIAARVVYLNRMPGMAQSVAGHRNQRGQRGARKLDPPIDLRL